LLRFIRLLNEFSFRLVDILSYFLTTFGFLITLRLKLARNVCWHIFFLDLNWLWGRGLLLDNLNWLNILKKFIRILFYAFLLLFYGLIIELDYELRWFIIGSYTFIFIILKHLYLDLFFLFITATI
jgi:hypothetical protein